MNRIFAAASWTARDLKWGWRQFVINTVGGHRMMPRLFRNVIYRRMSLDVAALDVLSGVTIVGRELAIGADTFVNHGVYLDSSHGISIGSGCALGPQSMIATASHALTERQWNHELVGAPVRIGDHVWLGARAIVLPGVSIVDDVVIGAGAVVTRDITTAGVYAGIPAVLVRSFDEELDTAGDGDDLAS